MKGVLLAFVAGFVGGPDGPFVASEVDGTVRVVYPGAQPERAEARRKIAIVPRRAAAIRGDSPARRVFPVHVLRIPNRGLKDYQDAAEALSGRSEVPRDRLDYYSAYKKSKDFEPIVGWRGAVAEVATEPGGKLVTVKVTPDFGMPVFVMNEYRERYFIGADGSIQYRGSWDPEGKAGQIHPYVRF